MHPSSDRHKAPTLYREISLVSTLENLDGHYIRENNI